MRGGRRTAAGFTLIELMIVVAMLALFAAIAVPSFTSFISQNRSQALNDELLGLLQYARAQAVAQRTTVRVCSQNGVWHLRTGTTACASNSSTPLRSLTPPSGAAISFSTAPTSSDVAFLQNGTTRATARFVTCYQNQPANGYTIDVARTGSVRSYARGKNSANGSTSMSTCSA